MSTTSKFYTTHLAYVRATNKEFRAKDESHLWPICGRFNATDRAIRRLQKLQSDGLVLSEYAEALDREISLIVNEEI
jgi:hypothetical protein